jgi:hypothetical protein
MVGRLFAQGTRFFKRTVPPTAETEIVQQPSAPLSPHWAFVVQLRVGTSVEPGPFAGRVEHVVSRQATHFRSLEELLAFMARVLTKVHAEPPQKP